eukprot:364480-Chlamydomonas_euryale.AAC.11
MVHDALGGGEHDQAEATARKQARHPVLNRHVADVVARRDDTALVQAAVELDHNLASAVVVNQLEIADVLVLLLISHASCVEKIMSSKRHADVIQSPQARMAVPSPVGNPPPSRRHAPVRSR